VGAAVAPGRCKEGSRADPGSRKETRSHGRREYSRAEPRLEHEGGFGDFIHTSRASLGGKAWR
jgi:hypothetical protein